MNVNDLVELRFGGLVEIRMERTTRIVHQIIEPISSPTVKRLADIHHESVKCVNVTGIEPKSRCFPAHRFDFADEGVSLFLIRAISEENIHASSGEIDRRVASEPAAPARNDRDSVFRSSNRFVCHKCSLCFHRSSEIPLTREPSRCYRRT